MNKFSLSLATLINLIEQIEGLKLIGMEPIDPLALELVRDMNLALHEKQAQQEWENEDLSLVKIRVLRGHGDQVRSCQFCYNDTKMLTASYDKTIKLWDFAKGEVSQSYNGGHTKYITRARIDGENNRFISAAWDKRLLMWDVESGEVMWKCEHPGIVTTCDLTSDGKMAVSASDLDNCIRIWDTHNGALIQELRDHHTSTVTSMQFSSLCDRLVTTSMDGTTKVYDLKTAKTTIALRGHINVVGGAVFSPDERWLASFSWDKSIKVWDITTGLYRTDGPLTFDKAHEGSVSACCWSVDGEYLVTGGFDLSVCTWNMETRTQKLKLQGHTDYVHDVDITRDKKWLLSASADRTVRLWDIENSDAIPVVLEQKKNVGLKITTCHECGRPFSVSQAESGDLANVCVFCRLSKRLFTIDLHVETCPSTDRQTETGKQKTSSETILAEHHLKNADSSSPKITG